MAWNFEKFLVGKDGTVIARFKSGVDPESAELNNSHRGSPGRLKTAFNGSKP